MKIPPLIERLASADLLNKKRDDAFRMHNTKFIESASTELGPISILLEHKLAMSDLPIKEIKRQTARLENGNPLYLKIIEHREPLPSLLGLFDRKYNSGINFFLPRLKVLLEKSYDLVVGGLQYEHFERLIGECPRIKDRGIFAFDNLAAGAVYTLAVSAPLAWMYNALGEGLKLHQTPPEIPYLISVGISLLGGIMAQTKRSFKGAREKAAKLQAELEEFGLVKKS